MRETRTYQEALADRAVLLSLWHRTSTTPMEDAGDKLRLMKLAWLVHFDLFSDNVKALNLPFYRWTWGPMSNYVYDDWAALESARLLESEERFVFTREGDELAKALTHDLLGREENTRIDAAIASVVDQCPDTMSTSELLRKVYAMSVTPVGRTESLSIEKVPKGTQLTKILDDDEARERLIVEPAWLETLSVICSRSASEALEQGEQDFREGRYLVA